MTNIQTFEFDQMMKRLFERVPLYKRPVFGTRSARIKAQENERLLEDSIHAAFATCNTTQAERIEVADRWLNGDFSYYVYFANARGIEPITLIVAALIEVQHYFFVPDGVPIGFKFTDMIAQILQTELEAAVSLGFDRAGSFPFQAYPPFSCNPVDNCLKTVDKSVVNSVDKSGLPMDNLTGIFELC